MKVFISWSGNKSHKVGLIFHSIGIRRIIHEAQYKTN